MTFTLTVPLTTEQDRRMLRQLDIWCNQHRINLIWGEGLTCVSLHFSGNNEAISALKAYLEDKALLGGR